MSPSLCIPKYRTRPKTQPLEVAPGSPGHLPGASLAQAPNGWVGSSVTGGIHDTTEGRQLDNCHYRTLSSGMLETSGNNSRAQMVFQQNLPCLHFWSLLHIKLKTLYIFLEVSQALMAAMLCQATWVWNPLTSLWPPRVAHPKHHRRCPSASQSPHNKTRWSIQSNTKYVYIVMCLLTFTCTWGIMRHHEAFRWGFFWRPVDEQ